MNNQVFTFDFNGISIPFSAILGNSNVMINATEMAKAFSNGNYRRVKPSRWIRSEACKRLVKAINKARNLGPDDLTDLIEINNGGTWMCRKLAIQYAQWLSEEFALWVSDRIDEILDQGYSFMTN